MTIVVDASVALKWVLTEPGSDAAAALHSERLIAPSFWIVEAANALWRRVRRSEITRDQAVDRMGRLRRSPVTVAGTEADTKAALDLALSLDHPVYDCLYLALALREQTFVITADRRFNNVVQVSRALGGVVRLLDGVDR